MVKSVCRSVRRVVSELCGRVTRVFCQRVLASLGALAVGLSGSAALAVDPSFASAYASTWGSTAPAWPSVWYAASAPQVHPYQSSYNFSGPLNPQSPRYFQPGYGYSVPMSPFRSSLQTYSQNYAFGTVAYGSPGHSVYGPSAGDDLGTLFGTTSTGLTGGLSSPGSLHSPWYFPGSPANDRAFTFGW